MTLPWKDNPGEKDLGDRPITGVYTGIEADGGWTIGREGVQSITRIWVPGNGAMVPWFEVLMGEGVVRRVNSTLVHSVVYQSTAEEKGDG